MHVLVIDDAPIYAKTVARHVRAAGHAATVANSYTQALSILRREGAHIGRPPIHIALCDHFMGVHSGYELLREIKGDEALVALPVVMLSNADMPELTRAAYEVGCAGWLTKDRLLKKDTISLILDYWDRCERVEI